MRQRSVRSNEAERRTRTDVGGGLYGVSLQSTYGQSVTTKFAFNYNNKSGNDRSSYEQELIDLGVPVATYQSITVNQGIPTGVGNIFNDGGYGTMAIEESRYSMIRGDVTWYKSLAGTGSHEFQTGFLLMPRNYYKGTNVVLDPSGLTAESVRLERPEQHQLPARPVGPHVSDRRPRSGQHGGARPRHRDLRAGHVAAGPAPHDDARRPERLRPSLRPAAELPRSRSPSSSPRGSAVRCCWTRTRKNVVRASYARVHRQLMGGRDAVAAFSGNPTSSSKTQYDANGDGIFESEVVTPAVSAAVDSQRFDPDFHQPFVDEFTTGYQRQLPLDMSLDLAWTHKVFRDSYAQTEINGFWPDTPGQPFGGFGMVDPRSGQIFRLTNRTWARQQFNEVMVTLAKNMSHNFQAMMSLQHQWQHEDGDWNPTDPARFIQPDAFANDKTIWRNQDPVDNNSLATGNTLRNTPTWTPGSFRVAGTWNAPKGIVLSTSYTMVGGPWTGPILAQLAANDPDVLKYGPARFNGTTPVASGGQANPLATRIRFLYPTRGEGQAGLPYVHTVNLKLAYRMKLANTRQLQVGFNIFNALNSGRYTEWHRSGANLSYDPNFYLVQDNQQTSRSAQFDATFRF